MQRLKEFLQDESAILVVLLLAFLAQMPHAGAVFLSVAHESGWLQAISGLTYAVALEVATLVFVMRGKIAESWIFACFSIAVNVCYYFFPNGGPVAKGLISLGLPLAIALYSHELSAVQVHLPFLQRKEKPAKAKPAKPATKAVQGIADESLQAEIASDEAAQDDSDRFAEYRDLQSKDEMVQAAHVLQMDFGLSNAEIADIIGKHETTIYRYLKEAKNGEH